MANLPVLRSKEQIISDLVDGFKARNTYITDLSRQSVLFQIFTATGESQFKATANVISMIDATSVDRAVGEALQRIARDKNVPIFSATAATGKVSITDTSFTKVASTVYAGQPAPVAGSLTIYVPDASKAKLTNGKIYIGRNTPNAEGPLEYSSVQPESGGAYWSVTLKTTSPTTKFHNIGEEVVFAQGGNRLIDSGSTVQTAQGATTNSIQFRTTAAAVILDGEVSVSNVPVICTRTGTAGNVPRGAIREAVGLPFTAVVFNDQPYFNAITADDDDTIRARIKLYEQSKARGTEAAIRYYSQGVISPDELKRVQSSTIVRRADNSTAMVFDDGTGYEPLFFGAGFEIIVDSAVGGERELQLRQRPVTQARIKTQSAGPYSIADLSGLSVEVNGVISSHLFNASEFRVPSAATPYEVAASINGDANINFLATTADGGTKLVIYPRDRAQNDIRAVEYTVGVDANDVLGFGDVIDYTLRLYKNDQPLYQDGLRAAVSTRSKPTWSSAITSGDTLTYLIDGTTEITAVFTTTVFQAIDPMAIVSYQTAIETWAKAAEEVMPGVTARIVGETLELSSNLGANNRAAIEITGGTLKDKIFAPGQAIAATGRASDYTFNKWTGQLSLVKPLLPGEKLTAGTPFTRGKVLTSSIPSGTTAPGKFWVLVDGAAKAIPNGLQANTQISFSKTGTKLTITAQDALAQPQGFDLVEEGDWLVIWSNSTDPAQLQANAGYWRVESVQQGQIVVDDGTVTRSGLNSFFIPNADRVVVARSLAPMQYVSFPQASLSLVVASLKEQLSGVDVEISGGSLRLSTKTADDSGELFFVAADNGGKNLAIPTLVAQKNVASQFGFVTNPFDAEASIPSFTLGILGNPSSDTVITQSDYRDLGGDGYDFIEFLNQYDAGTLKEIRDSSKDFRAFVSDYEDATSQLTIVPPTYERAPALVPPSANVVQAADRFYLRSAYQFDSNDQATAVVDQDTTTKTYRLPVARKLKVNSNSTPTLADFSADDGESSLALSEASSFAGFDFKDFKVWRQSHFTLTDGVYALRVRSSNPGPTGDRVRVGFVYPDDSAKSSLSYDTFVSDALDVAISLPVKNVRNPNWDYSSAFTVNVTSAGGKDTVTYQWVGGTQPDFVAAGVTPGDVAIINENSSFLDGNSGYEAKVTNVTATSFTIERPTGVSVADDLDILNIINQNGIMTVTTSTPHNLKPGQTIVLHGTAISTGATRPLDGAYTPTIVNATTFTIQTPVAAPGGPILGVNHVAGVVTLTIANHGLSVGNIILTSGLTLSGLNGLYSVSAVPDVNTVQYVRSGSLGSAGAGGRADFQSYGVGSPSVPIQSISRSAGVVSVQANGHGLAPGELVSVTATDVVAWSDATAYGTGDVVKFGSNYYEALTASGPSTRTGDIASGSNQILNLPNVIGLQIGQPVVNPNFVSGTTITNILSPTSVQVSSNSGATVVGASITFSPLDPATDTSRWAPSVQTFNAIWVVNTVLDANNYTFVMSQSGNMVGVAATGTSTRMEVQGRVARSIGGPITSQYLAFVEVGTTAQEVADFIAQSMTGILEASVVSGGSAPITTSTEDEDAGANYKTGNISSSRRTISSRNVVLTSDTEVVAGGRIVLVGMADSNDDGEYVVLLSEQSGPNWLLTVQTTTRAFASGSTAQSATFTGSQPYRMLEDGERSIASSDIGALLGSPQFTLKRPWSEAPTVSEEVRVVTVTNDHLSRFWSRLVVTGLTNVAKVDLARYATELQITTQKFGSTGSIQVAGGSGNATTLALVGSSGTVGVPERAGVVYVPYDLRRPVAARSWMVLSNTVRSNKLIGFGPSTGIRLYGDGIEIASGPGSFQTVRATTQSTGTTIKVEKQGRFFAVIGIAGASMGLATAGVKEGDWVKVRNPGAPIYSASTPYTTGDRVLFDSKIYAVIGSGGPYTNVTPSTNPAVWQVQMVAEANQGIYRVVRTFGQDAFWVEADTMIEEMAILSDGGEFTFYSYDSIMPGDTLVISTDLFGAQNIGRYTVRDELSGSGYFFPTPTRLYTETIQAPPTGTVAVSSYTALGLVVTLTLATAPSLSSGESFNVAGLQASANAPNGTFVATSVVGNVVTYNASAAPSGPFTVSSAAISYQLTSLLAGDAALVNVEEGDFVRLWKRVSAVGAAQNGLAAIMLDSPELVSRTGSSLGSFIELQSKLAYNEKIHFGVDAYKYYGGLIKELTRVIYGDPVSPVSYPGVRAAGTAIDISQSIVRRVKLDLSTRIRSGVPFGEVREKIKASVAGYINSLTVGQPVSLSKVVAVANAVSGVVSVAVTFPTYDVAHDLISVGADETAKIIDATTDITVSVLGT